MNKRCSYLVLLACIFNVTSVDARKRSFYESRLKIDPQLEAIWFADGNGNEITEDGDYEIEVGAELQLIIQANKDSNGKLAIIDMEEEACSYKLISDDYQMVDGFIEEIVLNGDSYDPRKPNRTLNNLTILTFIGIEVTDQCLEEYQKGVKKREKRGWCKKRNWPFRSSNSSKIQRCL